MFSQIEQISLKKRLSIIIGVGFLGPNPGSELISQINPILLALSATVRATWTEVSPEVVWEDARTRFPHPGYV